MRGTGAGAAHAVPGVTGLVLVRLRPSPLRLRGQRGLRRVLRPRRSGPVEGEGAVHLARIALRTAKENARRHAARAVNSCPAPERVAEIGRGQLAPGPILRLPGPGRVGQRSVVRGKFGIRFVAFGVAEVGLVDADAQVVRHESARDTAEEGESGDVGFGPDVLKRAAARPVRAAQQPVCQCSRCVSTRSRRPCAGRTSGRTSCRRAHWSRPCPTHPARASACGSTCAARPDPCRSRPAHTRRPWPSR